MFNEKCIVFSLLCMGLFLYRPDIKNNYVLGGVLFSIFVASYVAMAWYDYYFNCDIVPLRRGSASVTGALKPPMHVPEKQSSGASPAPTQARHMLIYAFHLLMISPMLGYIALYQNQINSAVYPLLGALSVFTAGYHGASLISGVH